MILLILFLVPVTSSAPMLMASSRTCSSICPCASGNTLIIPWWLNKLFETPSAHEPLLAKITTQSFSGDLIQCFILT